MTDWDNDGETDFWDGLMEGAFWFGPPGVVLLVVAIFLGTLAWKAWS